MKIWDSVYICYQFRVPRNLRIDIKDRLEEYSQSIEIDIHDCTQTQKSQLPPLLAFWLRSLHSRQSRLFSFAHWSCFQLIFANINISWKNNFNIEIQSVLNSQCVFFIWENNLKEFRVQFNAKQSSTTKLQSHP